MLRRISPRALLPRAQRHVRRPRLLILVPLLLLLLVVDRLRPDAPYGLPRRDVDPLHRPLQVHGQVVRGGWPGLVRAEALVGQNVQVLGRVFVEPVRDERLPVAHLLLEGPRPPPVAEGDPLLVGTASRVRLKLVLHLVILIEERWYRVDGVAKGKYRSAEQRIETLELMPPVDVWVVSLYGHHVLERLALLLAVLLDQCPMHVVGLDPR
mmetsp:Transcript_12618/g.29815  ORF Transcript_12618/g.29815 Transcript_12618/m.29815 type:complete len:210 (-) Transcript_12618:460-1089(-)